MNIFGENVNTLRYFETSTGTHGRSSNCTKQLSWEALYLSSDPVCLYFVLLFVLYLSEASLRLHLWRHTASKPGCSVMHASFVPSGRSWRTMSLAKASTHPSNSEQQ